MSVHSENQPKEIAELLDQIGRSRADLEKTINSLSEAQLTKPGPEGWSVKDHLAHLAVWELGVAEFLQRRPRFVAMQVEEAVSQGKTEDEINDVIYRRYAALPLSEVMDKFQTAHRQMLQVLQTLNDADLQRPYSDFTPDGSGGRRDPVINVILGNTSGHFDEHNGYIRRMVVEIG